MRRTLAFLMCALLFWQIGRQSNSYPNKKVLKVGPPLNRKNWKIPTQQRKIRVWKKRRVFFFYFRARKKRAGSLVNYMVGHYPAGITKRFNFPEEESSFAAALQSQMKVENDHIFARLGWILAANGFLFAAYGIALNSKDSMNVCAHDPFTFASLAFPASGVVSFKRAVSTAGVIVAAASLIGVWGAYKAINEIKRKWIRQFGMYSRFSYPFSLPGPSLRGRIPPIFISALMLTIWMYLLARGLICN